MDHWFGSEGTIITFLNKVGAILLLNLLFLLCCIPVVTIGSSVTSLYYAMVKSVRRERGYPSREFFRSMKRTLLPGSIVTVALLLWCYVLYINREYIGGLGEGKSITLMIAYNVFAVLTLGVSLYLFPVLSRFQLRLPELLKLTAVMTIRHLPVTIVLIAGFLLCGMLVWNLPMPFTLVLPGAWCYTSTFLIERILKKYMPKPNDGEDAWYYE